MESRNMLRKIRTMAMVLMVIIGGLSTSALLGCVERNVCTRSPALCADLPETDIPSKDF
jgi:hypothetical protein